MHILKQLARDIFLQTINLIDPVRLITGSVSLQDEILKIDNEPISLSYFEHILLIGFGKASLKMAGAVESILENRISGGIVVTNALLDNVQPTRADVVVGGHPYPDEGSLRAATRAMELVSGADSRTLIIYLISGGGSSLFERPIDDG